MTIELKPCPFCAAALPSMQNDETEWFVYCHICGAHGPIEVVESTAANEWNMRVRPLVPPLLEASEDGRITSEFRTTPCGYVCAKIIVSSSRFSPGREESRWFKSRNSNNMILAKRWVDRHINLANEFLSREG